MSVFATLQVELTVLGATDEGVPFGRREEEHIAVGLAGIADGDAAVEQCDLDGGGSRLGGTATAAPHGVGQISLELFHHAHSVPSDGAGRKRGNRYGLLSP
jgi:hypothetical protein